MGLAWMVACGSGLSSVCLLSWWVGLCIADPSVALTSQI